MNKKKVIPIAVIIVVIILAAIIFFVYKKENNISSMINKGNELMETGNYKGALDEYNKVLAKDSNDIEAKTLKEIITRYIDASTEYKAGDFQAAETILNNVDGSYTKYSIATKINDLRKEIKQGEKAQNTIDTINTLISEKNFNKANSLITQLEKENLTDNQKNLLEGMKNNVSEGLKLADANKNVQNGNDKVTVNSNQNGQVPVNNNQNGSNKQNLKNKYITELNQMSEKYENYITGMTQAEMNIQSGQVYKAWDTEINKIWGVLENNLSKSQMDTLRASQNKWIKEKEAKKKEVEKEFEGGSIMPLQVNGTLAGLTRERCYYLVNNYMK